MGRDRMTGHKMKYKIVSPVMIFRPSPRKVNIYSSEWQGRGGGTSDATSTFITYE